MAPPGPPALPAAAPAVSPGAAVVIGDRMVETTPAPQRARRRPLAALNGNVGLLRTSAADVGERWDLRLGLTGEFSNSEDFLVRGSRKSAP